MAAATSTTPSTAKVSPKPITSACIAERNDRLLVRGRGIGHVMDHEVIGHLRDAGAHFPAAEPHPVRPLALAGGYLATAAGALMTLGLFTRICAFLASGHLAVAYFMTHGQKGFYPALNGGEPAVMLCFVFFYLVFAGPGPLSLDAVLRKKG